MMVLSVKVGIMVYVPIQVECSSMHEFYALVPSEAYSLGLNRRSLT